MCIIENGFSSQLEEELRRKISLKEEVGNFFFIVAPRRDIQNKIEVICSLSLTASILRRDYNLFKNNEEITEEPFNVSPISAEYAADYLINLAKEFAKQFGLKPVSNPKDFGSKRIYFLILESIATFFITILNGVLSPQINLQKFSHLLDLILSNSANTLTI